MVVNFCSGANNNNNNLTNQLLLDSQDLLHSNTSQSQLREQLRTIQNHHLQQQEQTQLLSNSGHQSNFGSFEAQNHYTTPSQPSPSSASILLAAQLLFGNGNPQSENTPPHLTSSINLLSPTQMDTSQQNIQNISSANSADAGSPSSSHSNDMNGGDAEGVWSADIDQAFHEALQIYPPCGRRKIILSEEGKMYGRNELIARYIKIRCGKTRTRKQVSSHIQVLARKKNREVQSKLKTQDVKSEDFAHGSNFGSPKSTDSLVAAISAATQQQISPNNTLPQFQNHTGSSASQIKVEALSKAVAAVTQPTAQIAPQQATQLPTAAGLQWPYNMVPQMFNNNFYGNVTAGINNDENIYANFAAALSANAFGAGQTTTANGNAGTTNPLLSLGGLPASLGKILPNLPFSSANPPLFPAASQNGSDPATALASHTIASSKLTLCGFTAYVERENERVDIVKIPAVIDEPLETIRFDSIKSKFPELLEQLFHQGPIDAFFLVKCWANVSFDIGAADEQSSLYAVDSFYDSLYNFDISISSKVCSFGKQVVEKVEIYSANDDPNNPQSSSVSNPPAPYHYRLDKSPMCDYMVAFVKELKKLETSEMNCVLENFTVLQIVQNKQTDETLMVIAFNFEVSPEPESNCRVFRLVP